MDIWKSMTKNNSNVNILPIAFRTLLNNTTDAIFIKDMNLKYVDASITFVKMVGKKKVEDIIGKTDFEIFEEQELAKRYVADDKKLLTSKNGLVDYIEPIPVKDGLPRYGSTSKHILKDAQGNPIGVLGITRDITKEYRNRKEQQKELKYLFELPEDTYAATYLDVDAWRVINQRRQNIEGSTLQFCYTVEKLIDAAVDSIVDKECEASLFYRNFNASTLHEIFESGRRRITFEYERQLSDGSIHWIDNTILFLTDADSGHLCVMLSAKNIDDEKQEEEKLILSAQMDKMTMLLNRETTMDMIQEILEKDHNRTHALLMMDIDNFKSVNDTYGHQAGDDFLILFAAEVKKCFDKKEVVGRIGGDEIFALMRDVKDAEQIRTRAEELLKRIQKICAGYEQLNLSASIGISLYPTDGQDIEQLYAKADKALYHAKQNGKNQIAFMISE